MRPWQRILLLIIVLLAILSLLLSACGPLDNSHGRSNNDKDKDRNKDHGNGKDRDVGKDKDQVKSGKTDKILICHKTGSAKKPYVQISVASDAIKDGHGAHEGDIIPAPVEGCPEKSIATGLPTK
jgi:hypothetical protein